MSTKQSLAHRLYTGDVSYDFVGKRKLWYAVSAVIVALCVLTIAIRGLNLSIDFTGGSEFTVPTQVSSSSIDDYRDAVQDSGLADLGEIKVNTIGDGQVRIQVRALTAEEINQMTALLAERAGLPTEGGHQQPDRAVLGPADHPAGPHRARGVPRPGRADDRRLLPQLEDVGGRAGRAAARPRHHRRRVRAAAVRVHAGQPHRHADDPRLLAVRHGGRVRQGARQHPRDDQAERGRSPTPPTWRSTRCWSARSTPRSSASCRSPRSCSPACSSWAPAR